MRHIALFLILCQLAVAGTPINDLPLSSTLAGADNIPHYSSANGDTRRASVTSFKDFILLNLALVDANISSSAAIALSKLAPIAANTVMGNPTASSAVPTTFTCTAFARTVLDDATAADTLATLGVSAFAQTFLDDASAAAVRTTLGLVIGTDVQAQDAELAALAGLASAVDKGIQFTGAGTAATYDLTAFARTVLDDVNAAAARVTLGLDIGVNVQAFDAELLAIAGLASAADRGITFTGSGTAALYTQTAFARTLMDDATASAARATLEIGAVGGAAQNLGTVASNGTGTDIALANHVHKGAIGQDEGIALDSSNGMHTINLVGAGVSGGLAAGVYTITVPGAGTATITVEEDDGSPTAPDIQKLQFESDFFSLTDDVPAAGSMYINLRDDSIPANKLAANSVGASEIVGGDPGAAGAELANTTTNLSGDGTLDPASDEWIIPGGNFLRFTGGAGDDPPTNGGLGYDSTIQGFRAQETIGLKGLTGLLYEVHADSASNSNTSDTAFSNGSFTIPANSLTEGKTLRVTVFGEYDGDGGAATISPKVKIESTAIASWAGLSVQAFSTSQFRITGYITGVGAPGASVAVRAGFTFDHSGSSTTAVNRALDAHTSNNFATNGALVLSVTWAFNSAAGSSAVMTQMIVEAVN